MINYMCFIYLGGGLYEWTAINIMGQHCLHNRPKYMAATLSPASGGLIYIREHCFLGSMASMLPLLGLSSMYIVPKIGMHCTAAVKCSHNCQAIKSGIVIIGTESSHTLMY